MSGGRRRDPTRAVVACLDDDQEWLDVLRTMYRHKNVDFRSYAYPRGLKDFVGAARLFDYLLIDINLLGFNGAIVASELMRSGIDGEVFLISGTRPNDPMYSFTHYLEKTELQRDVMQIFRIPHDDLSEAVAASVLMQAEVRA